MQLRNAFSIWFSKSVAIAGLALVQVAGRAVAEEDYLYRIEKGDTLIGLSSRLLNVPEDWPKIARHNRLPDPNYIVPGNVLRVPFSLLKSTEAVVTVAHVQGDVKARNGGDPNAAVVALGESLGEGVSIVTGENGFATLKLPDGSTVRVQSGTEMKVERMRAYPEAGILESAMRVLSGRIESLVRKFRPEEKRETRHGVNTPLANLAVRGTEFRVTMDPRRNDTRGEVLEGAVAMTANGAASGKRLEAGFGGVVDSSRKVSDPIPLLPAPDVAQLPKLLERTILRFPLSAITGAAGYRAQVASDESFNNVVAEIVSTSANLRVANVEDGAYYLRVRAVDARGLEGRNALHAFTLKARPEPPPVTSPPPKGKVRATGVEFKWAENTRAAAYHLQVARDAAFAMVVHENKSVKGGVASVEALAPGNYYWRVASLRANGDHGPFGDPATFALFPLPARPEAPKIDELEMAFHWSGEPGQTFEFQLADEPKFAKLMLMQKLTSPDVVVSRPKNPGTYYMRYRAIDADGFVGPYTPALKFEVPAYPYPYSYPVPSLPLWSDP